VAEHQLRKLYGTGHGRRASHRGLCARHARLAVAAAAALVDFAVATYKVRSRAGQGSLNGRRVMISARPLWSSEQASIDPTFNAIRPRGMP
jgi:Abortive infection C-terminus